MRVSVMVLGDPAVSSAWQLALRMLEMAHQRGNLLDTVFLYHTGTYAALNQNLDLSIYQRWSHLHTNAGLSCVVCKTALSRMGIPWELHAPFRPGGLADWLAACERSDRVLRFGTLRSLVGPAK